MAEIVEIKKESMPSEYEELFSEVIKEELMLPGYEEWEESELISEEIKQEPIPPEYDESKVFFEVIKDEPMAPDYDEWKESKLFSDDELSKIIETRETFEYEIGQPTKPLKSYCKYIAYERNLVTVVTEKCKSQNDGQTTHVRISLLNHIKTLYLESLAIFPTEERLWLNYMIFCKYAKFIDEGSAGFVEMLQYHGDTGNTWVRAAMWEYYEANNINGAKDLLHRGMLRNPDKPDLYMNFLKMLLKESAKLSSELILENNQESAQSIELQRIFTIYENSKKTICDIDFFFEFFDAVCYFPFTKSLQKQIIDDMKKSSPCEENVWHTLAQLEFKGYDMACMTDDKNTNDQIETNTQPEIETKKTLKERIELALGIYQSAVKKVNTDKMWELYIKAMLEINQNPSTQQDFKRKTLRVAFKEAYETGHLSEDHFIHYFHMLTLSFAKEELLIEVLEKATTKFPSCIKFWELRLQYYIRKDEEEKAYSVFRRAIKRLTFESKPLWKIIIQYYLGNPNHEDKIDDIYEAAVKEDSPVFDSFKWDYVEWVALTKSFVDARKLYKKLIKIPPPSLNLFQKMAALESAQYKPDIQAWRECHENAALHFGMKQTDVWINYIEFERDFGEPKNMSILYKRAKDTLPEILVDNFIAEHTILTNVVFCKCNKTRIK